jgi:hypothetical protein
VLGPLQLQGSQASDSADDLELARTLRADFRRSPESAVQLFGVSSFATASHWATSIAGDKGCTGDAQAATRKLVVRALPTFMLGNGLLVSV